MRPRVVLLAFLACAAVSAQETRPKDVREIAKSGVNALPKLQELLKNPDLDIRLEAVKQIVQIGTQRSLDPLIQATADNDPEVQIRATDGLVNFYYPDYVRTGLTSSLRRVGSNIKAKFSDSDDQTIIPVFVQVRPDVIAALGKLVRGGGAMEVRANAARAIGVLRGRAAVDDLVAALHSKDTDVIYQSLIALQKIRDKSAATKITFLLRDLDPKVQTAAVETAGLLQNSEALPQLKDVLSRTRDKGVRRKTLTAIAMIPEPQNRETFARYLRDKDDQMRAAAAEGYARLKDPADVPTIDQAYKEETKTQPRMALAFALVMHGKTEISEMSPLQYLINQLNSAAYHGIATPYLAELARDPNVRAALYKPLLEGTKDEKIYLAEVLSRSGDKDSIPQLQKLSNDTDADVAKAGLRALRSLQDRL